MVTIIFLSITGHIMELLMNQFNSKIPPGKLGNSGKIPIGIASLATVATWFYAHQIKTRRINSEKYI